MRTSTILFASMLAIASSAGGGTAFGRSEGCYSNYQPSVRITAAPPVIDTGSEAYPGSPTGAAGRAVNVTAAPPVLDVGSERLPSSPTGASGRETAVIAGGPVVTFSNGESMPQSVNSFPPGFTNQYLSRR